MVYLILASFLFTLSFGLIKQYLGNLDPAFVAWARLTLALPVFLPFLRLKGLTSKITLRLMLIGGIQFGVMYSLYIMAFQYLDAYQVALFTIFTPLYVTLINDLFKRQFIPINLAMALLAVLGAAVIKYHGLKFGHLITGFLIMQVSNICFAFGQLEYRRLRQEHSELSDRKVYALLYLGAVIVTALVTTFKGGWGSMGMMTQQQFYILLYLGMIASGLGFFFWNVGAVKSAAGTLAVMNNLKVPLAIFVTIVFFGEKADIPRLLIGGGLMVIAVIITERYKKKESVA